MIIILAFAALVLMFVCPFLPGIIEYYQKTDADPLFVPIDFSRTPRYFGASFRHILSASLNDIDLENDQIADIMLSKKEKVEITADKIIPSGERIDHILNVRGNLKSGRNVTFNTNIFATGNVFLGEANHIHVLASDGNVSIAQGAKIDRWVDAEEVLDVAANCDLGISATSGGVLRVAEKNQFRRLYGMPIVAGINGQPQPVASENKLSAEVNLPDNSFIRRRKKRVNDNTEVAQNIVFEKSVKIGSGCVFRGAVKSYGNIDIKDNVAIYGNVFADGDVRVGKGSVVLGNIFSQGSIYLASGAKISHPGVFKSVIGKKAVKIEKGVIVYGYVATEGEGLTL